MKSKEEIEQLAEKLYFHVDGFEEEISEGKRHYILGYTQCQKDMADCIDTIHSSSVCLCDKPEFVRDRFIGIEYCNKCAKDKQTRLICGTIHKEKDQAN